MKSPNKVNFKATELAPRSSKRWLKRIFLTIILALALILGWIIFNAYSAVSKITQSSDPKSFFQDLLSLEKLKGEREGRTNFLILGKGGGTHPGAQLTDTIMVLSYRYQDKKVALLSIPRDLLVPIAEGGGQNKINYAYSYGVETKKGGAEVAQKTISNVLDQTIHYYLVVDFVGFKKLVDALGGVEVVVDKPINDPYYPRERFQGDQYIKSESYEPFYLAAGRQKLDGEITLKYARSRETTSDFDRAHRQQKLLVAIKDKALSLGVLANPAKLVEILKILGEHVRTNLSGDEMKLVLKLIKEVEQDKIINVVLDNTPTGFLQASGGEQGYFLRPKTGNFKQIQQLTAKIFEEKEEALAQKDSTSAPALKKVSSKTLVEIQNATGTPGVARQLSLDLKKSGYTIYALSTSKTEYNKTTIYDYSDDSHQESLDELRNLLGKPQVIRQNDSSSSVDFKIILGQDYVI